MKTETEINRPYFLPGDLVYRSQFPGIIGTVLAVLELTEEASQVADGNPWAYRILWINPPDDYPRVWTVHGVLHEINLRHAS
jgi:hypothetical protein